MRYLLHRRKYYDTLGMSNHSQSISWCTYDFNGGVDGTSDEVM